MNYESKHPHIIRFKAEFKTLDDAKEYCKLKGLDFESHYSFRAGNYGLPIRIIMGNYVWEESSAPLTIEYLGKGRMHFYITDINPNRVHPPCVGIDMNRFKTTYYKEGASSFYIQLVDKTFFCNKALDCTGTSEDFTKSRSFRQVDFYGQFNEVPTPEGFAPLEYPIWTG